MTAITLDPPATAARTGGPHSAVLDRPGAFRRYLRETMLLVGRSLRMMPRVPERLSDVTIQPVMFTLLFVYVFGSAIDVPGTSYENYLLPGLLGQTLAFGVMGAGTATATDLTSGVVDRFRSLPISRLAVVSAQVIGQVIEQIVGIVIVVAIGLLVGWRPDLDLLGGIELVGLMLLGLVAFTWVGVLMGMLLRSADAVMGIGFGVLFPLAFMSGAFVPIEGMSAVPRAIAHWEPVSALVAAVRNLAQGTDATGSWQLEHPIVAMVAWCLLIMAVCIPLAIRRLNPTRS